MLSPECALRILSGPQNYQSPPPWSKQSAYLLTEHCMIGKDLQRSEPSKFSKQRMIFLHYTTIHILLQTILWLFYLLNKIKLYHIAVPEGLQLWHPGPRETAPMLKSVVTTFQHTYIISLRLISLFLEFVIQKCKAFLKGFYYWNFVFNLNLKSKINFYVILRKQK